MIEQHAHGDPLALLCHILVDVVVGEAGQRTAMRRKEYLDIPNTERMGSLLHILKKFTASIERKYRNLVDISRHKLLRS